jgi:hypothetical protein
MEDDSAERYKPMDDWAAASLLALLGWPLFVPGLLASKAMDQ